MFPDGSQGEVYQVLLTDGEINHYVKTSLCPSVGMEVKGSIDWERRYKNMRVHSAGHVIDFSMYLLGISPSPLHPMKGDHGKKPFVQYLRVIEKEIRPLSKLIFIDCRDYFGRFSIQITRVISTRI